MSAKNRAQTSRRNQIRTGRTIQTGGTGAGSRGSSKVRPGPAAKKKNRKTKKKY